MIDVECGWCGATFEMYKSQREQRDIAYCSDDCRSKGMSDRYSGNLNKGRTLTEEHKQKLSQAHMGKSLSEETKKKMSESTKGENAPWHGKNLPDDMKEQISETVSGFEHTEKAKKKISDAVSGEKNGMYSKSPEWSFVEVEGIRVRSEWEADVVRKLVEKNIDFEYEPQSFEWKEGRTYTPDFEVDDWFIEVKGYVRDSCKLKAQSLVNKHNKNLIVYGSELGCGKHFSKNEFNEMIRFISEK